MTLGRLQNNSPNRDLCPEGGIIRLQFTAFLQNVGTSRKTPKGRERCSGLF